MARILVTGAGGYIGGHLVERLVQQGHRVRCLVRRPAGYDLLESLDVELVRGDVAEPETLPPALADVEVVYNVAGLVAALSRREMMRVNRDGVAAIASLCAQLPTPPLHILISSVAAAGPSAVHSVRREADSCAPVSHYGSSKRAGELAAELWADAVPTTIVRPGIVFGPRDRGLLPVFQSLRRMRTHLIAGLQSPRLSMIYVSDLIELILLAAERGKRLAGRRNGDAQGVYFACDEEYPTYAELGRIVRPMLDRPRALMLAVPLPVAQMMAGASDVVSQVRRRPDMFGLDKIREASVDSWACSPKRAQKELGFQAPQGLRDRLQQTVDWYREHEWL